MQNNGQSGSHDVLLSSLLMELCSIEDYILQEEYKGYDPYDALLSPLFRMPFFRNASCFKWAFQQVIKRLPFQARPLLGIRKEVNPVTIGLFLQGISVASKIGCLSSGMHTARQLVKQLYECTSNGWSGTCWGYNFPWQARYATIPAYYPTIVATGFITNALYHCYKRFCISEAADLLLSTVPFVVKDLQRSYEGSSFCWSYSPGDRQQVLNATMKGARLCAQAASISGQNGLMELAESTVSFVIRKQNDNGRWPYSVSDSRNWADNFHSGYILDCLNEYIVLSGDEQYKKNMQKGWEYYRNNYFLDSGAPKYYDTSAYPLDSTTCGQSIMTLVRFGDIQKAKAVASWAKKYMSKGDGQYKYQLHKHWENRLTYMRWSVAWMFLGYSLLANIVVSEEKELQ